MHELGRLPRHGEEVIVQRLRISGDQSRSPPYRHAISAKRNSRDPGRLSLVLIQQYVQELGEQRPRLNYFLFFLFGALTMLSFAPVGWFAVAPILLLPLLVACLYLPAKKAARIGFCYGSGLVSHRHLLAVYLDSRFWPGTVVGCADNHAEPGHDYGALLRADGLVDQSIERRPYCDIPGRDACRLGGNRMGTRLVPQRLSMDEPGIQPDRLNTGRFCACRRRLRPVVCLAYQYHGVPCRRHLNGPKQNRAVTACCLAVDRRRNVCNSSSGPKRRDCRFERPLFRVVSRRKESGRENSSGRL